MKKKIMSVLLSTAMVASMLAGCGSTTNEETSDATVAATKAAAQESTVAEEGGSETTADAARNWKKPRGTQSGRRRRSLPSVSGWRTQNGSVPSTSPRRARSPVVMCRSMTAYEPKQEMAAGMGVLSGRERQTAV